MADTTPTFTREQIIERLVILRNKLEHEGSYVRSNTVWLAIEELKKVEDPPFAVGEPQIVPATDTDILRIIDEIDAGTQSGIRKVLSLVARIKAERERFQDLRDNYKCGDEYSAGLWSRRNIEAFFRDQEKE